MPDSPSEVNPALVGLTEAEIIELRKQERAGRADRSAQEFATRFVGGRN